MGTALIWDNNPRFAENLILKQYVQLFRRQTSVCLSMLCQRPRDGFSIWLIIHLFIGTYPVIWTSSRGRSRHSNRFHFTVCLIRRQLTTSLHVTLSVCFLFQKSISYETHEATLVANWFLCHGKCLRCCLKTKRWEPLSLPSNFHRGTPSSLFTVDGQKGLIESS